LRALLDTSVLIADAPPLGLDAAISAASLAELHFGALVATTEDERARRTIRLGIVEATFDPLPVDAAVAREWGRLATAARGAQPRRRDLGPCGTPACASTCHNWRYRASAVEAA
jgi:predicted nucleic acid-binding protein